MTEPKNANGAAAKYILEYLESSEIKGLEDRSARIGKDLFDELPAGLQQALEELDSPSVADISAAMDVHSVNVAHTHLHLAEQARPVTNQLRY